MPEFHDQAMRDQRRSLNARIVTLEYYIAQADEATDVSPEADELEELYDQRDELTEDMRKAFVAKRDEWRKAAQARSAKPQGKAKG